MRDTKHVRHGPARGFALLTAALLLITTIVTPAFGVPEEPAGQEPEIDLPEPEVPGAEEPEISEPEVEVLGTDETPEPGEPEPVEPEPGEPEAGPRERGEPVGTTAPETEPASAPSDDLEASTLSDTHTAVGGWDHTKPWTQHGRENLPCGGEEHWVLSPTHQGSPFYNVTAAAVVIDGVEYPMTRAGLFGAYHVTTDLGVTEDHDVAVSYDFTAITGLGGHAARSQPFLKLSSCAELLPTPDQVVFQKVWSEEGDFDGAGVDVTFHYDLYDAYDQGTSGSVAEGVPVQLPPGGGLVYDAEEFVPGLPAGCHVSSSVASPSSYTDTGTGTTQVITVTNEVLCEVGTGTLRVTKRVTGEETPPWHTMFKFRIDCGEDGSSWFLLRNLRSWTGTFPAGAECTVTEVWTRGADEVFHRVGWHGPWVESTSANVTIHAGETTRVKFVNRYGPDVPPESVDITLMKLWLDRDGDVIDTPFSYPRFEAELSVGEQVLLTIDREVLSRTVSLETGTVYRVTESKVPRGWAPADCPDEVYGPEGGAMADGTGTFTATQGGRHFICNQMLARPGPQPTPTPTPTPSPEPMSVDIGLVKVWLDADGSVLTDPILVEFELQLSVDGELVTTLTHTSSPTAAWTELAVGTTYVVSEPTMPAGWTLVACPDEVVGDGDVAQGAGTFVAEGSGRHLVCNQGEVEVLPIIEPEPEPTPEPPVEPTPAPEPPSEPEVKGVTIELPATGLPTSTLPWLAGVLLLAGAVALTLERRPRMFRRR
jgi:hypothetical protein